MKAWLDRIVVLNLSLLIAHQIDAAWWQEWEMFRLPGGIQLFNVLNVIIFIVLLAGMIAVIRRAASGYVWSLVIAGACALVLPIHTGFALTGHEQFHLPVSIFLIVATFVGAITQILITLRCRGEFH